jgi:ATP-binding cassette subfamily F protein 3
MLMLTLSGISKSFGGRVLFENVTLQINREDRIALVGANGAGKSTLFSLILGINSPDAGSISRERAATIGYLAQESAPVGEETVLELATAISPEHARLRRFITESETKGDTESDDYHHAVSEYAALGGYQLDPKAKRILNGLAFRESDFLRPAKALSGGWVMRAHLARLLVQEPDLLMLDEPTNHLDLESLGWFQNYLQTYPGGILMISHDRAFLNALVDNILEIRNKQVHRYRGNYDDFIEQRAARKAQHLAAYQNQQKEIQALQQFADRFRAKASKAAQAQSKLKQIERMEKIDAPEETERRISIKFPQPPRGGQRTIRAEKIDFAYGDLKVYQGMEFEAERGQRIVLVGPNGAGKSTLLKLLGGVLTPQAGSITPGHNVKVGYFAQNRAEMFNPKHTVLEAVQDRPNPVPEQTARTVLGSFLFPGDDVFKPTGVLSGGEKSRLGLVKILLDPPNLLLLDEPTTHLDMASIDALIAALKQYEGTLIFISHDVYFIKALATSVLHISAGKLTPYAGDYDYYLHKTQATSERSALVAGDKLTDSRPEEAPAETKPKERPVFKTKEQKRKEAEERQARSQVRKAALADAEKLEKEIAVLEEKQKSLTTRLETHPPDVVQLNRELVEVTEKLEEATAQWERAAQRAGVVPEGLADPA